jgi:transposase
MNAKKTKQIPLFADRETRLAELHTILERAESEALNSADLQALKAAIETLSIVTQELDSKRTSLARLRKMLFGASTESLRNLFGDKAPPNSEESGGADSSSGDSDAQDTPSSKKKDKRNGHGRNPASAYRGAERVHVPHEKLARGAACPCCPKGKVYPQSQPSPLVRVSGMAPLQATVYECDSLRCNLCGEIFTAAPPPGVGEEKYDEGSRAMIALLKYGCGLPFYRIEKLQRGMGIPMSSSTQWELVHEASLALGPVHDELITRAAQGSVLHNDDTVMKVLSLALAIRRESESESKATSKQRRGIFTTGIVADSQGERIALFFTGRKHAGENLDALLAHRRIELETPIQMSDALAHNVPNDFATIVSNCLVHARRNFVDVTHCFPEEVRYVLGKLAQVYCNEEAARERALSPEDRLSWHQEQSAPQMQALKTWMENSLETRSTEPNSGLGKAIQYMLKHWEALTLFLRVAAAPLDNNLCERALKRAILHRKNALFYKTEKGAKVGDLFMSLIHTAELAGIEAFPYLVTLLKEKQRVAQDPSRWMPWNYRETLSSIESCAPPPP